jgi:hypothetical protein
MDMLRKAQVLDLARDTRPPCVSVYFPTHRAVGEGVEENRIRLRNALDLAEETLMARGMRRPDAIRFLEPAAALGEDPNFWQDAGEGVALFRGDSSFVCWKLPQSFREFVWVGERPYLKPLLPLLTFDQRFYVLAVSENEVELFQGTPFELHPIEVAGLPKNMEQALRLQQPEGLFQFRTGQPALHSKEGLVFYGQGMGEAEHAKEDLEAYFREIDRVVAPFLRARDPAATLVFCGVEYLFPIYRRVNSYSQLYPMPITGSPGLYGRNDLLRRANDVLRPQWEQPRLDAMRRIESSLNSERVSANIEEILPAARQGRVEVLFVALDEMLWGTYDAKEQTTQISETADIGEDLLDRAATEALLTGARVYAVPAIELPAGLLLVALFRY